MFTRVTACTLALSPIRDTLIEGFSHFVTSMTAPIASGWSGCRVGFAPTGKRRLVTAHTRNGQLVWSASSLLRLKVCVKLSLAGLPLTHRSREIANMRDEAFDSRAQCSIFQRHDCDRPRPRRQIDRQHFQREPIGVEARD